MEMLATCAPPLINSFSYELYRNLMQELVIQHKTTGKDQRTDRIAATRLNLQRMKRVEKQFILLPEIKALFEQHQPDWHWVVLTEAWCCDSAQMLPALAAIAAHAPSVKLSVLLRHQNPNWMNTCATNGNCSIPRLLCLDSEMCETLFTWGPRPYHIQKKYLAYRAQHTELTTEEAARVLNTWYARDRCHAFQHDLFTLMEHELLYFTAAAAMSVI